MKTDISVAYMHDISPIDLYTKAMLFKERVNSQTWVASSHRCQQQVNGGSLAMARTMLRVEKVINKCPHHVVWRKFWMMTRRTTGCRPTAACLAKEPLRMFVNLTTA